MLPVTSYQEILSLEQIFLCFFIRLVQKSSYILTSSVRNLINQLYFILFCVWNLKLFAIIYLTFQLQHGTSFDLSNPHTLKTQLIVFLIFCQLSSNFLMIQYCSYFSQLYFSICFVIIVSNAQFYFLIIFIVPYISQSNSYFNFNFLPNSSPISALMQVNPNLLFSNQQFVQTQFAQIYVFINFLHINYYLNYFIIYLNYMVQMVHLYLLHDHVFNKINVKLKQKVYVIAQYFSFTIQLIKQFSCIYIFYMLLYIIYNIQIIYNKKIQTQMTTTKSIKIKLLLTLLLFVEINNRMVYPQGLWPMNAFGQFIAQNQQILAYYDVNRDRFVDIITRISSTTYQLQIYTWSQKQAGFVKSLKVDMEIFKPVLALIGDITGDNQLDLVLGLQQPNLSNQLKIVIYSLSCTNSPTSATQCTMTHKPQITPFNSLTAPTIMQIQGKNILVYNNNSILQTKYYQNNAQITTNFVQQYFLAPSIQLQQQICSNYNTIFYIDYNGDCFQDMIIYCNDSSMADIQFYRGNQNSQFVSDYRVKVENGMKLLHVTVADLNFDGLVDIVQLLSNPNGQLYLQINYNTAQKQKYDICKITIQSQTNNYFPYHFIKSESQLEQQGVILQIQRIFLNFTNIQWSLEQLISNNFILRTGDINNDGYTDIIIDGPNKAQLLINQQCLSASCGNYNPKYMQKWPLGKIRIVNRYIIDGMNNYNGKICKMSFFDINQDGRLDLFTNLCPIDNFKQETPGRILAVYNSLGIDAFFLKITILENLDNQIVNRKWMDKRLNVYGGHVDFYVTALNGERVPSSGNQLSHPGRSLQLPYIHRGLGRTNNYVQQLSVSVSANSTIMLKTWSPIVPNSQLIIIPGPKWIFQTYISPTATISILFWFVVLILILVGAWIIKLTRQQKIQDKQNQDSFYTILR